LHLLIFGLFQFLVLLELYINKGSLTRHTLFLSISISLAYGITAEIIQYFFVVGREGSIFDLLADILGIILASGIFCRLRKIIDRLFLRKI
jgi:VanZ family protein